MGRPDDTPGLRYHAIAAAIRSRIEAGSLRQGDTLPSQASLAREFSTSVMTVRQAIKMLEGEGLIVSRHGVGSFVSGMSEDHRGFELQGFRRALDRADVDVTTEVVRRIPQVENKAAAQALGVRGTTVSAVVRLRSMGDLPLVYQVSYVPVKYRPVIETYQPGHSLYAVLNRHLNTVISQAEERLTVAQAHDEIARLLQVADGTACLFSQRISKELGGNAVLYDIAYMRSDRVELRLSRKGPATDLSYTINTESDG